MWSIGNEIPIRATAAGYNLSHVLSDYVRSLDNTRVVTSACKQLCPRPPIDTEWARVADPHVDDAADPFFAPLEVY